MAGDWVKIRVWLHRDPKLISMADYLAGEREFMKWLTDPVRQGCKESAYEHVTRNVICHVTRSLLVTVWGVARERGRRDGDDLILIHCDLTTIDEIAEVPCVGEAMAYVGWAAEERSDDQPWQVRFPNFFAEEEPPHHRHREQNAERQRRHREKKRDRDVTGGCESNVTRNVTVTHREEKRREEKREDNTPPPPTGGFDPPTSLEHTNGTPKKPRRKAAAEWDGTLPPELDVPDFREAWRRWEADRKARRRPLTDEARRLCWRKCIGWGVPGAVASIEASIASGWQGLFDPPSPAGSPSGRTSHADRAAARNARIDSLYADLPNGV